jgi:hypothetical protein
LDYSIPTIVGKRAAANSAAAGEPSLVCANEELIPANAQGAIPPVAEGNNAQLSYE